MRPFDTAQGSAYDHVSAGSQTHAEQRAKQREDILDELNLSEGEDESIDLDRQQRQIVISPVERPVAVNVDEAFARQVDDFIREYRPALESLAK